MTMRPPARSLLASCLLLALSVAAHAGVVECINEAGAASFSDLPCATAADAERGNGDASGTTFTVPTRPSSKRTGTAASKVVATLPAHPARQILAPDLATMNAARMSTIAMDEASALERQQAKARRIRSNASWAFWRT